MISRDKLKEYNFVDLPHFTVMESMVLDLGRNRVLSIGCIGEPNEMMVIKESDRKDDSKPDGVVVIHNYDYDGYLTEEKLICLLKGLGTLKCSVTTD